MQIIVVRWTKTNEEQRLCSLWLQEPLINPETGHSIRRNGPTFNSWKERCKSVNMQSRPLATKQMTWRKCQEWQRNPMVNPDTGRKIARGGATYKWIKKECQLIDDPKLTLEGEYYIPDQKGMVPAVLYRGTWYVIRTHQGRKVWGPLNKPAKKIKLRYYADTWDYHYNHYKPIYIGRPAPKRVAPIKKTRKQKPPPNPKYVVDDIINLFIHWSLKL